MDRSETKQAYLYPFALMLFVLVFVVFASYGLAEGPWYKVVYPDGRDAFAASSNYVEAIVSDDQLGSTVYLTNSQSKEALRQSGAILLDPQGVSICLSQ